MMVTVLYRLAGEPDVSKLANPFQDVKAGTYYSDAVRWAAANEIACGVTDTRFQPNGLMTREQMATFLYRYAKLQQEDTTATLTRVPRRRLRQRLGQGRHCNGPWALG
ncbi:MAG: S-layer homology domain-containing protein [Oscillospiraceae bacterium]